MGAMVCTSVCKVACPVPIPIVPNETARHFIRFFSMYFEVGHNHFALIIHKLIYSRPLISVNAVFPPPLNNQNHFHCNRFVCSFWPAFFFLQRIEREKGMLNKYGFFSFYIIKGFICITRLLCSVRGTNWFFQYHVHQS